MEKINQIPSLNKKARSFLLEHCVSKRGAEVMAFSFTGYINSNDVEDKTLIRISGKWFIHSTHERIVSISGNVDSFHLTKNTLI